MKNHCPQHVTFENCGIMSYKSHYCRRERGTILAQCTNNSCTSCLVVLPWIIGRQGRFGWPCLVYMMMRIKAANNLSNLYRCSASRSHKLLGDLLSSYADRDDNVPIRMVSFSLVTDCNTIRHSCLVSLSKRMDKPDASTCMHVTTVD